jgi:hypothetical protein
VASLARSWRKEATAQAGAVRRGAADLTALMATRWLGGRRSQGGEVTAQSRGEQRDGGDRRGTLRMNPEGRRVRRGGSGHRGPD